MSASRARRIAVAFVVSLNLILGVVPGASAAGPTRSIPNSIAAVGDSITQAASSAGSLGSDAPQNSWATGTSSTVNSHFLRLRALNSSITAFNRSVSGAKMANLNAQMSNVVALSPDPGYLTVLMGGNDLCTDTVAQMTSVADFRAQFAAAMTTLTSGSPGTSVYVVSIPNVYQLWNLFKGNFWARFIWSSAGICQSLLANPTSTQPADVQRREAVRQRNLDYNAQLAQVCATFTACHFDGNAAFNTVFTTSDVSGDYFHPSVSGQAKLSDVSWRAGYEWASPAPVNRAPTAVVAVPSECTATVACTGFEGTGSTDADGDALTYTWNFGDGATATGASVTHTYASASGSPYTVTLVVSDGNATDDATASVTVVASSTTNQAPTAVAAVPAQCTAGVACTGFDGSGSSDPDGDPLTYTWSFGDGTTATGASVAHTYASAAGSPYTVSLTVSDGEATDDVTASVAVIAPSAISLSVTPSKVKGIKTADLTWSGAGSTNVDVYRDDAVIAVSTLNDSVYRDSIGKGGGTHTYKVCDAGTTTCSPLVSASY